jgi:DNA polymerase-1
VKLLLVDGSNIVMRCAFGGDIAPPEAIISAAAMIERVAKRVSASHLVIAFDYPDAPTWRHELYPSTRPAGRPTPRPGSSPPARTSRSAGGIVNSRLASKPTTSSPRSRCARSRARRSRALERFRSAAADGRRRRRAPPARRRSRCRSSGRRRRREVQDPAAHLLYDFKAMTGEPGDNIPGVPGIGLKRAANLLHRYGDARRDHRGRQRRHREVLEAIVAEHEESARLSLKLVSLNPDAPIEPITNHPRAAIRAMTRAAA